MRKRANPPTAPLSSTEAPKPEVNISTSAPKKKKPKRIFLKIIHVYCFGEDQCLSA